MDSSRPVDEAPSTGDAPGQRQPGSTLLEVDPESTTAGAAEAATVADQRRARHRDVVRQSYYRKLDILRTLRGDVRQLEQQFADLATQQLQQYAALEAADAASSPLPDMDDHGDAFEPLNPLSPLPTASSRHEELRVQYTRETLSKEALLRANDQLQRQVDAHGEFERRLRLIVEEQAEVALSAPPFRVENHPNGTPPAAPRVVINPLTSIECRDVSAGAHREIHAFLSSSAFLTSGESAFGWQDRRTFQDGKLMFSLKKRHHGVDAAQLARRGWEECARRLRQFYPSSMDMTHYEVQQVDADNTVLYRVMVSPDRRFATKTLMLVSHVPTETGGAMIIRSLDPSRVRSHRAEVATPRQGETRSSGDDEQASPASSSPMSEEWVNAFTWILFDRAGSNGEHCVMDFGGIVSSNTVVSSDVWMLEVLPIALRLESVLISPPFTVAHS